MGQQHYEVGEGVGERSEGKMQRDRGVLGGVGADRM